MYYHAVPSKGLCAVAGVIAGDDHEALLFLHAVEHLRQSRSVTGGHINEIGIGRDRKRQGVKLNF